MTAHLEASIWPSGFWQPRCFRLRGLQRPFLSGNAISALELRSRIIRTIRFHTDGGCYSAAVNASIALNTSADFLVRYWSAVMDLRCLFQFSPDIALASASAFSDSLRSGAAAAGACAPIRSASARKVAAFCSSCFLASATFPASRDATAFALTSFAICAVTDALTAALLLRLTSSWEALKLTLALPASLLRCFVLGST